MSKFRKDEWALYFHPERGAVSLVRIAENVYDGQESCLVYMGAFTTKNSVSSLHKLPASMKKLMPKDKPGKTLTTMGF